MKASLLFGLVFGAWVGTATAQAVPPGAPQPTTTSSEPTPPSDPVPAGQDPNAVTPAPDAVPPAAAPTAPPAAYEQQPPQQGQEQEQGREHEYKHDYGHGHAYGRWHGHHHYDDDEDDDEEYDEGDDDEGEREPNGFYFRVGLGFGAFHDNIFAKVDDEYDRAGKVSGVGTAFDIAVGGTPSPGLVIGGTIFSTELMLSEFTPDEDTSYDGDIPGEVNSASGRIALIGPFVNYWFTENSGLHFDAALGFAALNGARYDIAGDWDEEDLSVGAGIIVGLGHDWFVDDQWSVGVAVRLTGAMLFQEDRDGDNWIHVVGTMPSVLFTAMYY